MDKKINYIHLSKIRLLPVIFLLLCSCVVFAQMPTELARMELMKLKGKYYELYNIQAEGYLEA